MIGGKLGEVLNKDIGALVKDAGKVLNADIGDLVRAKKVEAAATTDVATVFEPAYAKERLDETLVVRHNYAVPTGSDSAVLLPHTVGDFARSQYMPSGQIASDPVSAMYGLVGEGHDDAIIYITLTHCWDRLEAIERIASTKANLTRGTRIAADGTWIAGRMERGIALAWTRDAYCFTVHAPAGVGSLATFLKVFPY